MAGLRQLNADAYVPAGRVSDRKLRLFAVACARRHLHLTQDCRVAEALNVAERFADGSAGDAERSNARKSTQQAAQVRGILAGPDAPKWARRAASLAYYATARHATEAAWNVPLLAGETEIWRAGGYAASDWRAIRTAVGAEGVALLRDIFGNPFRRVAADPSWLTSSVTDLAERIYEVRAFDRLPELAVALENAGCHDEAILNQCRSDGPHVRGCWVIDLLTGRS